MRRTAEREDAEGASRAARGAALGLIGRLLLPIVLAGPGAGIAQAQEPPPLERLTPAPERAPAEALAVEDAVIDPALLAAARAGDAVRADALLREAMTVNTAPGLRARLFLRAGEAALEGTNDDLAFAWLDWAVEEAALDGPIAVRDTLETVIAASLKAGRDVRARLYVRAYAGAAPDVTDAADGEGLVVAEVALACPDEAAGHVRISARLDPPVIGAAGFGVARCAYSDADGSPLAGLSLLASRSWPDARAVLEANAAGSFRWGHSDLLAAGYRRIEGGEVTVDNGVGPVRVAFSRLARRRGEAEVVRVTAAAHSAGVTRVATATVREEGWTADDAFQMAAYLVALAVPTQTETQ